MAGMTTSSLVSLYDPDDTPSSPTTPTAPSPSRFTNYLGLDPTVTPLNALSLLSSSLLTITFFVSLNSIQPFLLTSLGIKSKEIGNVTGTLILVDEIVSLSLYFVFGVLADRFGVRMIASGGHLAAGMGMMGYAIAGKVWPWLLVARIIFAVG